MITMKFFFGETDDLSDAYMIRQKVFVEEQNVSEAEEYDGTDGACVHIVAYDNDAPVSTGRVMITPPVGKPDPYTGEVYTHDDYIIGRVATLKSHRGQGLAAGIMDALIDSCRNMGGKRVILHAQLSAKSFYEKLGFTPYGEEFEEAGIRHISMEMLPQAGCKGCKSDCANKCE